MENFNPNGHISSGGFNKLIHENTTDLERLEFSEHLSFCGKCLETYVKTYEENLPLQTLPFSENTLADKIMHKETFKKFRIYLLTGLAAAIAVVFINMCLFSPTFSKNLTEKMQLLKISQTITDISEKFEASFDKISDNLEIKIFKEDFNNGN